MFSTSTLFSRTAAKGTAEEGSIIIFIRSQISFMACLMLFSETVTISATSFLIISKLSTPSDVRRPSAMVWGFSDGTILPALNERNASSAPAGSQAITFVWLPKYRAANAVPASKPPPPTGARMISRFGISSKSSFAAVACPQTISNLS